MNRRTALLSTVAGFVAFSTAAFAQQATLKIGVMNDMSGPYADYQGIGSVAATKMAVDDFAKKYNVKVEVVSADHQNKADVGVSIARRWYENEGVDVIMDIPNSAVALAVANLTREKNKVFIGSGAGAATLTGAACSPNTIHWTYDTFAYGNTLGKALVKEGVKKWFFITADYAFGKDLEKSAADAVVASGGVILGSARHPVNNADFSSYILQAQASGADVIALANAGDDTNNTLKQAAEFGVGKKQRLATLIFNPTNIAGLGLKVVQNVKVVNAFYWDQTPASRAFSDRFRAASPTQARPNDMQAGMYSAVLHLLKGMEKTKSAADGKALVDAMKALPTDDPIFGKGSIRVDGRKLHNMYLYETKTLEESKDKWDTFKLVTSIPGEEAFRSLAAGGCPLVKQ